MENKRTETLKKYWKYNSFLENQEVVIQKVLEEKNVLTILPTGAGKSVCYQLPAILLDGTCLVISPLIALMKDQVASLKERGIKAEAITSELSYQRASEILDNCRNNKTKLLYISPERIHSNGFLEQLQSIHLSFLAVDEAHCISEWGHDFRPSYLKILSIRKVFPDLSILALTATATKRVEQEIIEKLELQNPFVVRSSIKRDNLSYQTKYSETIEKEIALELLKNQESAIVFTQRRKSTYDLSNWLSSQGLNSDYFHAKLNPEEKNSKQQSWTKSDNQTMVATNAFGMGIDKSNLRKVIHHHLPNSIENYVQEVGRAGRDGKPAQGILFYNQKSIDLSRNILDSKIPNKKEFIKSVKFLYDYFQISEGETPEESFRFLFYDYHDKLKIKKGKVQNILNFLHNKEIIQLKSNQKNSKIKILISPKSIQNHRNKQILEYLVRKYPGIFYDSQIINEYDAGRAMNISTKKLVQELEDLNQEKTIQYQNKNFAELRFLVPRENRKIEGEYWKWFKELQQRNKQKLEDLIFFVTQNQHCRQVLLQRYFGEKTSVKCGKCDICLKESVNPKKTNNLSIDLLEFIESEPKSSYQIQKEFKYQPKSNLIQTLQNLIDEGKVLNLGLDRFVKNENH